MRKNGPTRLLQSSVVCELYFFCEPTVQRDAMPHDRVVDLQGTLLARMESSFGTSKMFAIEGTLQYHRSRNAISVAV